ncbi:MAG: hypothetical protein IJ977_08185 [Fibrobacter sp.]|nr:hypothetical protein [Fibrobacter sp.]
MRWIVHETPSTAFNPYQSKRFKFFSCLEYATMRQLQLFLYRPFGNLSWVCLDKFQNPLL